jgi:hypothetical protein
MTWVMHHTHTHTYIHTHIPIKVALQSKASGIAGSNETAYAPFGLLCHIKNYRAFFPT